MDSFNIVFTLSEKLTTSSALAIIKNIRRHPILWKAVSNKKVYSKLWETLGADESAWQPVHICFNNKSIEEIRDLISNGREERNDEQLINEISYSVTALSEDSSEEWDKLLILRRIILDTFQLKKKLSSWNETIYTIGIQEKSFSEILNIWGTIFTIVLIILQKPNTLLDGLLNSIDEQPIIRHLFSFLLHVFSEGEIGDYLLSAIQSNKRNTSTLIHNVIQDLEIIGDKKLQRSIVDTFFNENRIEDISRLREEGYQAFSFSEKLYQLENLRRTHILAKFSEQSQVFAGTEKEIGFLWKSIEGDLSKTHTSIGEKYGGVYSADRKEKKIIRLFGQLSKVYQSDKKSAILLCREIKNILENNSLYDLLFNETLEYQIDPIKLFKIFKSLNLIRDLESIIILFIEKFPNHTGFLEYGADFFFEHGNHERSIDLFSALFIKNSLTRESKKKLISSLIYLEKWGTAFDIYRKINFVNDEEYYQFAGLALLSGDKNRIQLARNSLLENGNRAMSATEFDLILETPENILDIIRIQPNLKVEELAGAIDLFTAFLFKKKKYQEIITWISPIPLDNIRNTRSILFLIESLILSGKIESKDQIVNSLIHKKKLENQNVVEYLIKDQIKNAKIDEAETLLLKHGNQWDLSPNIIIAKSEFALERKEFFTAKDILQPLINQQNVDLEGLIAYGCSILGSQRTNFPLAWKCIKITEKERNILLHIADQLSVEEQEDLNYQILQSEFSDGDRIERYRGITTNPTIYSKMDAWRAFAGLGAAYAQKNHHDFAISNFLEAFHRNQENTLLVTQLIRSYQRLNLPQEVCGYLKLLLENESTSLNNILYILNNYTSDSSINAMCEDMISNSPENLKPYLFVLQGILAGKNKAALSKFINRIMKEIDRHNIIQLYFAYVLVEFGQKIYGKRIINNYLSMNKDINKQEIIICTALFYQIGDYEKSVSCANLLNSNEKEKYFILADIHKKTGEMDAFQNDVEALDQISKMDQHFFDGLVIENFRIPKNWIPSDKLAKKLMALGALLNKNLQRAFDLIESIDIEQSDINKHLYDLAKLIGKSDYLENAINNEKTLVHSSHLLAVAEYAIQNGNEVFAARIASNLNTKVNSPRTKALLAKLLKNSGDLNESQKMFAEIDIKEFANTHSLDNILEDLCTKQAVAETALEFNNYSLAITYCKKVLEQIGCYAPTAKIFLSAVRKKLEQYHLCAELLVSYHNEKISEDIIETMDLIEKESDRKNISFEQEILVIRYLLYNKKNLAEELSHIPLSEISGTAKIISAYKHGFSIDKHSLKKKNNLIFPLSVFEVKVNASNAKDNLLSFLKQIKPEPIHYAALAYAQYRNKNYSEAYASINLALTQWPEEFEWELLASEISKKLGDLQSSFSHAVKAFQLTDGACHSKRFLDFVDYLNPKAAIPLLEKAINEEKDKIPLLIKLGHAYERLNMRKETMQIMEQIIAIDPHEARAYNTLAKLECNIGNIKRSRKWIEKSLITNKNVAETHCLYAEIIMAEEGKNTALSYLSQLDHENIINFEEIIICQSKIMQKISGLDKSVSFLQEWHSKTENKKISLELANNLIFMSKMEEAKIILDELVGKYPEDDLIFKAYAEISRHNGDLDKSIAYLTRSISINPFNANFYIKLADIYYQRREKIQAIKILNEGRKTNINNATILKKLGFIHNDLGEAKIASEYLKEAKEIDFDNMELKSQYFTINNTLKNTSVVKEYRE